MDNTTSDNLHSSSDDVWADVDRYFGSSVVRPERALESVKESSAEAGLPPYEVTASQGKFLSLLVRLGGAKRILEIGALGGYSTIWLARAIPPDGQVITLEIDPMHAQVSQENFGRTGLSSVIDLRVGDAFESLANLDAESSPPFDFVFIDADKEHNAEYFDWALKLSHPGTLIVVDNVVRNGAVADINNEDPDVRGVRNLANALAANDRVDATVLQTVGTKGYDGFLIALVK